MADPKAPAASAEDLLIPILIASNPGMKLDYKTMSALDGTKTPAAFEHRFRKYRARAQEILASSGGVAGAGEIPGGLVPVTPTKKRVKKSTGDGGNEDGADGEETPKKKARMPKNVKNPATPETPTTPKAVKAQRTPKSPKAGKVSNGKTKKVVDPEMREADDGDGEGLDAAKHAKTAVAGEKFLQEMSFEFEGASQGEDQ